MKDGSKVRVPKLVRMHSSDMEEVEEAQAGDIVAMFGVDCASGTTFTDGTVRQSLTSMFVPDPVVSLALVPKARNSPNFSKALGRFTKEDPTFRVHTDDESGQTIISGMGELHLEIYVERMRREYGCGMREGALAPTACAPPVRACFAPHALEPCCVGQSARRARPRSPSARRPRSTPPSRTRARAARTCSPCHARTLPRAHGTVHGMRCRYTHKKQSGGSGQYGKVEGYIEPLDAEAIGAAGVEFRSELMGNNIPPEFLPAIEKGFKEAMVHGPLCGNPVMGVRVVLQDGAAHAVDSNETAFRSAAIGAFREAMRAAKPLVLEPVMEVEVAVPAEYQGAAVAQLSQRKGTVNQVEGADYATIVADVPLQNMFGYSSDLRSATQGKGEYSMEYKLHMPVPRDKQEELIKQFLEVQKKKGKDDD